MVELTSLEKHLYDSSMDAISVLQHLKPTNLYKTECILCQVWQEFTPEKRKGSNGVGGVFKRLVAKTDLPLEYVDDDSDGSARYRIINF